MNEQQIADMRQRLLDEREQLTANQDDISIANENQDNDYGVSNHPAQDATEVFLRERNIALNNNAEEIIAQIDSALERMDNGTYGQCARCGQMIAPERLEALPYANYCINCQAIVERESAP